MCVRVHAQVTFSCVNSSMRDKVGSTPASDQPSLDVGVFALAFPLAQQSMVPSGDVED